MSIARREWASPRTGRRSGTARGLASTARTSRRSRSGAVTKTAGFDYPPTNRARLRCPGGARGSAQNNASLTCFLVRLSCRPRLREQRLKSRRDERDSKICRRGRIGVSHQGTRSAARGFRQRGAGFRALRAFAATDRVARRSRLERASNLRSSVGDEPDTHTAAAAARCLAPAPTPCSARRRRSS